MRSLILLANLDIGEADRLRAANQQTASTLTIPKRRRIPYEHLHYHQRQYGLCYWWIAQPPTRAACASILVFAV